MKVTGSRGENGCGEATAVASTSREPPHITAIRGRAEAALAACESARASIDLDIESGESIVPASVLHGLAAKEAAARDTLAVLDEVERLRAIITGAADGLENAGLTGAAATIRLALAHAKTPTEQPLEEPTGAKPGSAEPLGASESKTRAILVEQLQGGDSSLVRASGPLDAPVQQASSRPDDGGG